MKQPSDQQRGAAKASNSNLGVDRISVGTFLGLGSPLVTEICAASGFDWLLIDLEHGAGGEEAAIGQILASALHRVPTIVRVASCERIHIGRALDLGAAGVMVPRVEDAAQVAQVARWAHYPPEGERGVAGYVRSSGYGTKVAGSSGADRAVTLIVQIETLGALAESRLAVTSGVGFGYTRNGYCG